MIFLIILYPLGIAVMLVIRILLWFVAIPFQLGRHRRAVRRQRRI